MNSFSRIGKPMRTWLLLYLVSVLALFCQSWSLTYNVVLSILVSSFFFVVFCGYVTQLSKRARGAGRFLPPIALVIHGLLLGCLFLASFPGYYNVDSFFYLENAIALNFSEFMGFYYSGFLNVLIHLFPYSWTLSAFQHLMILLFLFHLFLNALELKKVKFYILACLLFYLYPINLLMCANISRDPLSHWIFALFLIELWRTFYLKKFEKNDRISLLLWALFSTLFRPEVFFILVPFLLFILLKEKPWEKTWSFGMILVLIAFKVLPGFLVFDSLGKRHYETTLLINPLSSILRTLYPQGLPLEVDSALGSFFKNDHLIKYASEYDIEPYHRDGINYSANEEDYFRFRNEALSIIARHPALFLRNRLNMAAAMLGFSDEYVYLGMDEYDSQEPFAVKTKAAMGFQDKPELRPKAWPDLFQFATHGPIPASYIIPLGILAASLLLSVPGGWFQKTCLLLFARTLLVLLVTPASYFKYNYSLWLFAIFSIPVVVMELKSRLKPVQRKYARHLY